MKCKCSDEHNRTLVITDLPTHVESLPFPELKDGMKITIGYVAPREMPMNLLSMAIMLDNVVIPAIVKALNKRNAK